MVSKGTTPLTAGLRLVELLKRPQLNLQMLREISPRLDKRLHALPEGRGYEIAEAAEILLKYDGYIIRERELAEKTMRLEDIRLKKDIDYNSMKALSTEARQKLSLHRPETLGQASRIPGVSPADITILLMLHGR